MPPDTGPLATLTKLLSDEGLDSLATEIIFTSRGESHVTTLGTLRDRAARFATGLRALGVAPRDRVAVQFPNSEEAVIVQLAALMLDAVLVPVVPVFGVHEMSQILAAAEPKVLVTTSRWRNMDYAANLAQLPAGLVPPAVVMAGDDIAAGTVPWHEVESAPSLETWATPDEDALALLIFTSGSTGVPKGVKHSRRTLLAEAVDLDYRANHDAADLYLHTSGAGHIGGYVYVLRILEHALRVVSVDGWDVKVAARVISQYRPSSTAVMPMHLAMLLELADAGQLDLSSLQLCMIGGAPVPERQMRRAAALGMGVVNSYGLSELPTAVLGSLADPVEVRAKYVGRANRRIELRITDDHDKPLPAGERGELQIRGPELFLGYTNVAEAETFAPDGWFRTGDVAVLESDGLLQIVDRKKNLILRGGENLSATEIESILQTHPDVAECAVIGVPDERYGERVAAFVVPRPGQTLTLVDLMDHFMKAGSSKQKVPEYLELVTALPKTGTGKLRKHDLKLSAQAHSSAARN